MPRELIHRFEQDGKRYAIDPETCFCFEPDAISWDVLAYYPLTPANRIYHELGNKYGVAELAEVIGELEWLRATKSILPIPKKEDFQKDFEVRRGLKRLTIALARQAPKTRPAKRGWFGRAARVPSDGAGEIARRAVALLVGRSETEKELELEFTEERYVHDPDRIAELCAYALKTAKLAGKTLTAAVHVTNLELARPPEPLRGHTLDAKLELQHASDVLRHVRALAKARADTLAGWLKVLQHAGEDATGRIVVRPNHPAFAEAVEALDKTGFGVIELDMDGAYAAHPELEPQAMLEGMRQSAVYYAQRLLEHHYFRLDPIASLFWRIYQGTPQPRSDLAGTNELAIDDKGDIYPSRRLVGIEEFRVGSVAEGTIDEDSLKRFDDVGALTTPACIRCWARNLCGGGNTAVHRAFTGSFRTPHEPWCDAQRASMAALVSAFNVLSSKGVNFTRVYSTLGGTAKPSLFTMARAAFRMSIGVRPVEEADAEPLAAWENWNSAAYFVCNETGLLLATKYDREMDVLHSRGIDQELVLIRKNGEPFGLLKVRPERFPGTAWGWVYMRDEADYASEGIRKSFRFILEEAGAEQAIRRLLVLATPTEKSLREFLQAVGFEPKGALREALYLHGAYHDVAVYGISLDQL